MMNAMMRMMKKLRPRHRLRPEYGRPHRVDPDVAAGDGAVGVQPPGGGGHARGGDHGRVQEPARLVLSAAARAGLGGVRGQGVWRQAGAGRMGRAADPSPRREYTRRVHTAERGAREFVLAVPSRGHTRRERGERSRDSVREYSRGR